MQPISNMSLRDNDQISKYEHEDDYCAKRVYVVGGEFKMEVDPSQITDAIKDGLKDIKFQNNESASMIETKIERIEVPVVIPGNVQVIEVKETIPVIQTEIKIVEIEKPIIQEKVVTVEKPIMIIQPKIEKIEVPVIVEKTVEKIPTFIFAIITLEAAIIAALLIK